MSKLVQLMSLICLFTLGTINGQTDTFHSPTPGPSGYNDFVLRCETTLKDIETRQKKVEKEIQTEPTKRSQQATEVDSMLASIIELQKEIDRVFEYRSNFDQSQRDAVDRYKNRALRFNQELTQLKKKLQSF